MSLSSLNPGQTAALVIVGYMLALILLGLLSQLVLRMTVADYFVASRGLGSVMLLMSPDRHDDDRVRLDWKFRRGVGIRRRGVWENGLLVGHYSRGHVFSSRHEAMVVREKYGYVTQIQFFRDRFESDKLGVLLFPVLVGLLIPYVLVGVISSGSAIEAVTAGAFPDTFQATKGAVPYWLGSLVTCVVVLYYISAGGVRGTAWVNALQTVIFLVLGFAACYVIADRLGGPVKATQMVIEHNPTRLKREVTGADVADYEARAKAFAANPKGGNRQTPRAAPGLPAGVHHVSLYPAERRDVSPLISVLADRAQPRRSSACRSSVSRC